MNKYGTKNGAPSPNLFFIQYSSHLLSLCIEYRESSQLPPCPEKPRDFRSPKQNETRYKQKAIQNPKTMTLQGPARNTEKDQVSTLWGLRASLGSRVSDFVELLLEIKYQT